THENPRALIAAPTALEILALGLEPGAHVHPQVLARALEGHGRLLVGADEDQVELRIAAHLSKDPFLLDIFARKIDPHSTFAAEAFPQHFPKYTAELAAMGLKGKDDLGEKVSALLRERGIDPPEEWPDKLALLDDVTRARFARAAEVQAHWSKLRDLTKRGEYAKIYRGEAGTVHRSIVKDMPEVTYKNVADLLESIGQKMKGVVAWGIKMETHARLYGEVRTALLGRVRLFPLGNFSVNVVANQPIQSEAAFLLALAMFRFVAVTAPELIEEEKLYARGLLDRAWVARWRTKLTPWRAPAWLILNGHDSLVAEADEEDAPQARALLEDAMTQELTIDGVTMKYTAKARVARRASEL
ncbi:MAG: DNA polymerase, partial [Dehalococcoidia bacterium]|nr:DNA polymerase [Dehalococcoidia bacterium]